MRPAAVSALSHPSGFLADVRSASLSSPTRVADAFDRTRGATVAACAMAFALSVAPTTASAQTLTADGATRRVVILNTADPYLPAFIALDHGVRDAIVSGRETLTSLHAEPLDMYRFPQAEIDGDVVALLGKKYRGLRVDAIVAAAEIALHFAEKHRAAIWPGAAIVFHSVPEAELRQARLDPRTIGVPVRLEFGPTLDLALKLRPGTQRVAVVAGAADPDRSYLSLARTMLEGYEGRLDVQYLAGLTLPETVAAVKALPSDAVVLYLTVFRDGEGAPLVPRDVLTRVAAASPVPVFGVFETYLGHGIVAGSIAGYEAQGRRAGELVVRVLNGEDPAAIGVQAPAASGCMADWKQLRRWGIDERLLPDGCEVRFKEVTAWDRYRWQILAALAVILAQAALIAVLMLSRRRLRDARTAVQDEHGRRTQVETIAERLRATLARFSKERSLGAMATAIAHEINQPLIAIQNYAQAAKRRLEGDVQDRTKLLDLVAKIEGQATRAGAITQRVRSLVSTGDLNLAPAPLAPLLEEVVRLLEPETESRGCHVTCELARDLPAVLADPLQVQLVLVNLLRNAMESVCSSGQYDRHLSVDVRPIDGREVQVSVTDRGPGVPPDRVADIFEPLASGTGGGMGMGLAISRAIIDAHGGRLWHEPNPAGGAIFRFTLRAVAP